MYVSGLFIRKTERIVPPFSTSRYFVRPTGNGLKALPAGISGLTSLRTLRLSNNLLTRLPPELKCLSLLEELHVGGNHGLKQEDLKTLHRHRPALRIIDGDQKGVAAQGSCAMNESDDRSGAIDTVI